MKSPVDWSQTPQPAMLGLGYETRRSGGGALSSFSDLLSLSHLSPFGPRRTPGRAYLGMTWSGKELCRWALCVCLCFRALSEALGPFLQGQAWG